MKTIVIRTVAITAAVFILCSALAIHTWYFKPLDINWYYQRFFLRYALHKPQTLSSIRLFEQFGFNGHNAQLDSESPQSAQQMADFLQAQYQVFQQYQRDDYTGQARLSFDVFDHYLSTAVEGNRWRLHEYQVKQIFSLQTYLPEFMLNQHVINNALDARHYIQRLHEFPTTFQGVIDSLELSRNNQIIPPRFAVRLAIEQCRAFIATPPEANSLYTHFEETLDQIPHEALPQPQQTELKAQAQTAVVHSVYPAYRRLLNYLQHLLTQATHNDGVWRLPDGDQYYAYLVKRHTTTQLTPTVVHQLGLREVDRIARQLDAQLRQQGMTTGTIGERLTRLARRPDQHYSATANTRQQILQDYQTIVNTATQMIAPYFHRLPEARVEVAQIPTIAEKGAASAYYQPPSLDHSRPGRIFFNLHQPHQIPRFVMRTLAHHEGVPGHHLQKALTLELDQLPYFRRLLPFTVFSEGWALYAERLAWEAGLVDDPLDNIGRLQAEMFRAARLVVDTGLHAKRWTREQSIQYLRDYIGLPQREARAEVERYLVMPGQALAYKVGMLKLMEFRQQAERALGNCFDIKDFHNQVLSHGELPMNVLQQVITRWVNDEKATCQHIAT